jgi:hypothetical protein
MPNVLFLTVRGYWEIEIRGKLKSGVKGGEGVWIRDESGEKYSKTNYM